MAVKEYLTKEKFEELKKELEYLKTEKRKEVARDLEYAKSLGDLSENAEYHEARDVQANTEDRISKLEALLKVAEIVSLHHTEKVGVGSIVKILKDGASEPREYKVVGTEEADMLEGKLSLSSPMGEAMIGKKKGDSFSVATPVGKTNYKIVEIA